MEPQRSHLLLVDDEPDILRTLAEFLGAMLPEVRISTADSGPAALRVLENDVVDLLVTDYKMPRMTGLELVVKARLLHPDIAMVMLTAFPDMELAIRALNEGQIKLFLTKPVEPLALRDSVQSLLSARRAAVQRAAALKRSVETAEKRKPPAAP